MNPFTENGKGRWAAVSSSFFYEIKRQAMDIKYGQNLTFYAHFHQHLEFFLSLGGQTKMVVEDRERLLQPGEAAFVWPNAVHSYAAMPENAYYLGIVDVPVIGGYASTFAKWDCTDPFIPVEKVHPEVWRCMEALMAQPDMAAPLKQSYLGIVVGRLLEALPLTERTQAAGHDTLRGLMEYIHAHIAEPLSLERLSRELFMNKYSISKLFSQRIGCSLRTYLNAIRTSRARAMLADPGVSIHQVIEACGFESERTFYRVFQANCGATPRACRTQASRPRSAT